MLRLLLDEGGATFQILTLITHISTQAQNLELLIEVSLAKTNVACITRIRRIRIAYNMASFPQPKNTLATCLASWYSW